MKLALSCRTLPFSRGLGACRERHTACVGASMSGLHVFVASRPMRFCAVVVNLCAAFHDRGLLGIACREVGVGPWWPQGPLRLGLSAPV